MHLRRLPVFGKWVQHHVGIEILRRQQEFCKQLNELINALAPDVDVPGVTDAQRQDQLCSALRTALPRLMCRHLGEGLFDALPSLLSNPPKTFETAFSDSKAAAKQAYELLAESRDNIKHRESNQKLLAALEQVASELQRYGDEKPQPEPSEDHLCPISRELMVDPVSAADGHVYERSSIEKWIRENGSNVFGAGNTVKSPKTNEVLEHTRLTPAHIIRSQIIDWKEKYGVHGILI